MVKYFCDRCGQEITNNGNAVAETTEIKDYHNVTILTIRDNIVHICDECQYAELTCGFKVGDQVVTADGCVGIITSFCDCDRCKERGFYEPTVKMEIGDSRIWMTDTDKKNGFKRFYQIGNTVFGNIDEKSITDAIKYTTKEINRMRKNLTNLKKQLYVMQKLKKKSEEKMQL